MLKNWVTCLLLIATLQIPAAAETTALPEASRLEAKAARAKVHRVALAQHRDGLEELSRAVAPTVFFRTDSKDIDSEILTRIRLLGEFLREFPELRVYLDAHSDRRGSNAHNRLLSRARADVIAGVLQDAGIPVHRIHGNAWGESRARATTDDAEGLIFDRRVDIQLSLDPEA